MGARQVRGPGETHRLYVVREDLAVGHEIAAEEEPLEGPGEALGLAAPVGHRLQGPIDHMSVVWNRAVMDKNELMMSNQKRKKKNKQQHGDMRSVHHLVDEGEELVLIKFEVVGGVGFEKDLLGLHLQPCGQRPSD